MKSHLWRCLLYIVLTARGSTTESTNNTLISNTSNNLSSQLNSNVSRDISVFSVSANVTQLNAVDSVILNRNESLVLNDTLQLNNATQIAIVNSIELLKANATLQLNNISLIPQLNVTDGMESNVSESLQINNATDSLTYNKTGDLLQLNATEIVNLTTSNTPNENQTKMDFTYKQFLDFHTLSLTVANASLEKEEDYDYSESVPGLLASDNLLDARMFGMNAATPKPSSETSEVSAKTVPTTHSEVKQIETAKTSPSEPHKVKKRDVNDVIDKNISQENNLNKLNGLNSSEYYNSVKQKEGHASPIIVPKTNSTTTVSSNKPTIAPKSKEQVTKVITTSVASNVKIQVNQTALKINNSNSKNKTLKNITKPLTSKLKNENLKNPNITITTQKPKTMQPQILNTTISPKLKIETIKPTVAIMSTKSKQNKTKTVSSSVPSKLTNTNTKSINKTDSSNLKKEESKFKSTTTITSKLKSVDLKGVNSTEAPKLKMNGTKTVAKTNISIFSNKTLINIVTSTMPPKLNTHKTVTSEPSTTPNGKDGGISNVGSNKKANSTTTSSQKQISNEVKLKSSTILKVNETRNFSSDAKIRKIRDLSNINPPNLNGTIITTKPNIINTNATTSNKATKVNQNDAKNFPALKLNEQNELKIKSSKKVDENNRSSVKVNSTNDKHLNNTELLNEIDTTDYSNLNSSESSRLLFQDFLDFQESVASVEEARDSKALIPNNQEDEFSMANSALVENDYLVDGRVVGGEAASLADFPFAVHVSGGASSCSGALISTRYVLVPAACVQDAASFSVRVGALQTSGSTDAGTVLNSATPVLHPKFRINPRFFNIALLRLNSPAPLSANVVPIDLVYKSYTYDNKDLAGKTMSVIGFGSTRASSIGNLLRSVNLTILSSSACFQLLRKAAPSARPAYSQSCLSTDSGSLGLCGKDDLGSLVVSKYGTETTHSLVGLVTYISDCGSGLPSLFTRIGPHYDWIMRNLFGNPNIKI